LLGDIRRRLAAVLGDALVGIYVCGSLTGEDFDEHVSDVDGVAVTGAAFDENQLTRPQEMHHALVSDHVAWDNRIEVVYVARDDLAARGAAAYPTAVVSPGEPLHLTSAPPGDNEWLLNWRALREESHTLCGPTPATLIAPISAPQLRARVRKDLAGWPSVVRASEARHVAWQAYAILTVCCGACVFQTGLDMSKSAAAEWAKSVWPQHREVIDRALRWRQEQQVTGHLNDEQAYAETVAFIDRVAAVAEG